MTIFRLRYFGLLLVLILPGCRSLTNGSCVIESGEAVHSIYVVSHGWHAGIVINQGDVSKEWWPEQDAFPTARFLEVGWGDSAYYQHPDPGIGVLLRAGLLPTPGVLHVVGFTSDVTDYFSQSEVIRLEISKRGMEDLSRYIHDTYKGEYQHIPEPIGPGLYGKSYFYRARGTYHVFNNCNHWAARALREAHCPVSTRRSITVGMLLRQVREIGRVLQRPKNE